MSDVLQVTSNKLDDLTHELDLVGQMESKGAEHFKSFCEEQLQAGNKQLIIDMSKVTLISSSGIGALMVVQEDFQDAGGWVRYVSLSREVRSVVRLMDLESILNLCESKEEALQDA